MVLLAQIPRVANRVRPLTRTGLSLVEAEMLLDWLEANGLPPSQIEVGKDGVSVTYYPRPHGAIRQLA